MANNTLNYEFNLEVNKASIEKLKQYFLEVEKVLSNTLKNGPDKEIEKSLDSARNFIKIMNSSYDSKLGQFDMSKIYNEINKSYGSVTEFKKALESTSSVGARAYNEFSKVILNTNLQLSKSSELLDKMADTMAKTIRWGIASRVMNNMAGSIQKAWDFSVKLDKSLNDIRIVTDKSANDMERFAETANRAAKGLGASTRDYTEAALIFYQQGLNDAESQKRAEITLKAANVTGQSTQDVSEQLTAIWNGYKVSNKEAELYIDKVAAVAADTAADLEELATGMSKVASAANLMGVDIDQLNAQLATVVSVTRQAPESVGVAFKTIYARMGDIKAGLDDETTLGNYTSKMAELGVNVLDANGNLRDMGEVIEEIGNNWQNLSREQQINLSQTMAGVRQYNNLLALFDNWDMYTDALETSANAAGTLQHQQDIYMESVEAHLQKMRTEAEETYKILFDTDTVNVFIDALTGLNSLLNVFLKGLGGGINDFIFFGTIASQLLNKQIAGGIQNVLYNLKAWQSNKSSIAMLNAITEEGFSTEFGQQNSYVTNATTEQLQRNSELLSLQPGMKAEKFNELNNLSQEIAYYQEIIELKEAAAEKGTEETQELENQIEKLRTQKDILQQRLNLLKEGSFNKDDISNWINSKDNVFSEDVKNRLAGILNNSEGRSLTKEEYQDVLNITQKAEKEIDVMLDTKQGAYKKIIDSNGEVLLLAQQEHDVRKKTFDVMKKEEIEQQKLEKHIKGISSIVQLGTSLSGMVKTVTDLKDGTIEWGDALGQIAAVSIPAIISGIQSFQYIKSLNISPTALAIGAAIAAVAIAVATAYNEISLAVDKEKALKQELERNKKAVEESTKAYEELKNTVSNYKDAKNGISELTEGTLEYYEAIMQANEQAQKLIDLLKLTAGSQYQIDSHGLISINEEELEKEMFKEAQKNYRNQLRQSSTQYNINQQERDAETRNYIERFRERVNNKTDSYGFEISYEQAQKMIDQFVLKEQETVIDIGELTDKFAENQDKNFNDLCVLITKEMAEVKAPINELNAKRDAEAAKIGSDAIRAYGTQDQIKRFDELPDELGKTINQDIGNIITNNLDERRKNGTLGRDFLGEDLTLANVLPKMWAAEGTLYTNLGLGHIPGLDIMTAPNRMFAESMRKQQQNYWETQAIPEGTIDQELEKRMETMANYLGKAFSKGNFEAEAGGKYVAQAQYEAQYNNGQISEDVLKKMTSSELEFVSKELESNLGITNQTLQDYINKMREANASVDEFGRTQERIAADLQDYNNTLEAAAQELDVSTKTMELYGDAVLNTDKVEKKKDATTANAIKRMATFNKIYNEAIEVYEDNQDALEDYANAINNQLVPSLEATEGAAAVSDKLEEMGLSLNGVQLAQNIDLINTLLTGTGEEAENAYRELEKISLLNVLEGFDTSVFDKLEGGLQGFVNSLANIDFGPLDDKYAEALRKMINDSNLTKQQIQELLSNMHIESPNMDINAKETPIKTKPSTRTISYRGYMPDLSNVNNRVKDGKMNRVKNIPVHYNITETISEGTFNVVTLGKGTVFNKTSGPSASSGSFARSPSNSGSSGGGGGSTAEPKQVDLNDDEADRYHEVDTQIKKVDNSIKQLQSQTKKLVGQSLIDNLNKQWQKLNDQVENYNEKLRIAQGEQNELRNKLAGQGVAFNADGTIGNYTQAFAAQQAQLNNIINYYNSLSSDGQKGYQATLDAAQERFKDFQKDMDRYDTLVSDFIPNLQENIQSAIDKQIDIQIQEFDMAIELRLDLTKATKDWNEFKKKIIDDIKEDDILGNAQARLLDFSMYYDENGKGVIQSLSKQLNDTLAELAVIDSGQTSKVYGDDKNKALEDLKNEINQSYLDMMDEAQEKFDKQIEAYETLTNIIDHDKNLVSLIYGDEAYGRMAAFYDKQHENYLGQLNFASQQVEFWKEVYENAEEGSEAQEKAHENLVAATENLNGLLETSIEHLQDKYLNSLNLIFQDLNKKVTNGLGLEYVEEEWTLINKNADQYLDKINQLYGIQSLESKYLDAINDNTSLTAQKKLKDIMDEELTALREKDKLTEYDLERANKRYEIALKEIALEEAKKR